jgi:hypothetical protein
MKFSVKWKSVLYIPTSSQDEMCGNVEFKLENHIHYHVVIITTNGNRIEMHFGFMYFDAHFRVREYPETSLTDF